MQIFMGYLKFIEVFKYPVFSVCDIITHDLLIYISYEHIYHYYCYSWKKYEKDSCYSGG